MMAIAAGGNAAGNAPAGVAAGGDAADEANVVANEAAGDDTIHGGFHVESPVRSNDAPKSAADAAGRAEDPSMLTILSDKLDRYMGRIATLEKDLGTSKQVMGGAILKLIKRVKRLEKQAHLRRRKLVIVDYDKEAKVAAAKEDDIDLDEITALATPALGPEQPAVPTENVEPMEEQEEMEVPLTLPANKGKAPMPDLDIPSEFLAEDAQARKRLEEEQASKRLVQQLRAEDLAQERLDPTLARELLGADVNEENFIPRMNAMKERKKRALADLRYRALQNKPLKKSEVTEFMRAFVKGQWCAAHNGTITMQKVRAMNKQQLIEEYEYICKILENARLLTAQHNLFRPKPAITEPSAKRQRVEEPSSQPATVSATSVSATTVSAAPRFTDSTVITTAAMDSAVTRSQEFFLNSDEEMPPGVSRVVAEPDSDDEVVAEILFQ
nr:hypothetical protein [Tanacetum cinerariifolium]